jgi:hypothetical protein
MNASAGNAAPQGSHPARHYAELLANDLAKLGTYWRIGDAPRVAQWLGVTYPPYVPSKEDAGCPDRELIGLVEHARQWITQTLRDHGIIPRAASGAQVF